MKLSDALKVMVMLCFAVGVVALFCYARVDLGMTQEQINSQLDQWLGKVSTWTILIWSQILVAAICGLAYKIWKHRRATQ